MKLNLKVNGDVSIKLTPDPDSIPLDICKDILKDPDQEDRASTGQQFWEEAISVLRNITDTVGRMADESEDINDNKIVMLLKPGNAPKVTTFAEANDIVPGFYEDYECMEDFMDGGIHLYHRKNQIFRLEDEKFLIGTAVICYEDVDGDLWSLCGRDIYDVFQHMEERQATVYDNGKQMLALVVTASEAEEGRNDL